MHVFVTGATGWVAGFSERRRRKANCIVNDNLVIQNSTPAKI